MTDRRALTGWGNTAPTYAHVEVPESVAEAAAVVARNDPRGTIARGLGRAYGDAAQRGGGTVVDATHLVTIDLDEQTGVALVEGGASLDDLIALAVPVGWFVPVTPGTRFVTIGGAIASDIHGKNHVGDGTISRWLHWIELALPDGSIKRVSPTEDADAFWATCGGMGMTGLIVRAELQLKKVPSSHIKVAIERLPDLDAMLTALREGQEKYRYSVAWIDLMAKKHMGRGAITQGDFAELEDLSPRQRRDPYAYKRPQLATFPPTPNLITRLTTGVFNEVWFRHHPKDKTVVQTIPAFFHPLDMISSWNRVFGRAGVIQWQCQIPFGAEDVLRRVVEAMASERTPSFLAVLKTFGPQGAGHLSFPAPGWTLSVDIPATFEGLAPMLDAFDEQIVEAGGRIYLAKDGRLRPELMGAMYPRLDEWRAVQRRLDPDGHIRSDLATRLQLV
jgi:decaprenylphospho-beta-D-ribofuranose 2-oxidase